MFIVLFTIIIRSAEISKKIKGETEKQIPKIVREQLLKASLKIDISLTPNTKATDIIDTIAPTIVPNNDTCMVIFTALNNNRTLFFLISL